MKDMVYKPKSERELLEHDTYKGHEFYVISLGTHPCAYVKLRDDLFIGKMDAYDLNVHGGITFRDTVLNTGEGYVKGRILGWDYAHARDYMGYYETDDVYSPFMNGYRYTTEEIISECKRAIDEIINQSEVTKQ